VDEQAVRVRLAARAARIDVRLKFVMMVSYWPGNRPHVTARHPGHGYRVGSLPVADAGGDEGVSPDGSAGIVAGGTD
jgi:hypothetical protein